MDYTTALFVGALIAFTAMFALNRFLSFKSQSPVDYSGTGPAFDIRQHLNGPILCEGVIYGPLGRVTSRFVADIEANWTGDTGVMKEVFRYDSGAVQEREWQLTLGPGGTIRAEAADVVGQGSGRQEGCAVLLNYKIKLPQDSGGHILDTTDWMYLMGNGAIINRSQFRKFGFKVAELVATMRPHPALEQRKAA